MRTYYAVIITRDDKRTMAQRICDTEKDAINYCVTLEGLSAAGAHAKEIISFEYGKNYYAGRNSSILRCVWNYLRGIAYAVAGKS